ncbi:hypothetical protein ANN_13694, partial [Periplaneta americana]
LARKFVADDDDLFSRLIFSDEATFHTSGKINKHNCRVWGTQKPQRIIEHERDSPKVNVSCALSQRKLYGPFFFIEATVTGHSYLDMLELWLMPQLRQGLDDDFIFQQDGAPPHFHNAVRAYLNTEMFDRWIGISFKVCRGSLYAVMWLVVEPREFNLPTLSQRRITYVSEKLPCKYGVHSEEYLRIRTSVNWTKTGLDLTSDTKKASLMRQLGQEVSRAIDVAQSADSLGCSSGAMFGVGLDPTLVSLNGFVRGFPQPWD